MTGVNSDNFGFEKTNNPAQVREHEVALFAKRMTEVPSNMQGRWIYNTSNQAIHAGYAPRGLATSNEGWLLHKLTYSGALTTKREIAYDSWDNATLACYL